MTSLPQMAITVGDPAGIGPEIAAKALADPHIRRLARFVVFGNRSLWPDKLPFECRTVNVADFADDSGSSSDSGDSDAAAADIVTVVDFPDIDARAIPVGQVSAQAGRASISYILAAIDAVKAGRLEAICTGPIHKDAIRRAGYQWPGHTELFAEKFDAPDVAMMFAGGPLRVVLVTIHLSLRQVLQAVTRRRVLDTLRLTHRALREMFGIENPVLGVCGLNPHAGEAGRFGDEESTIIAPAIDDARSEGIDARGPYPGDTIFRSAMQGQFDIVVAMYHDQGLIPIKTVAFEESVNITIGIPAIRTSVDHGTAFDIAGRDIADPSSMKSAIRMAVEMIHARRRERRDLRGNNSADDTAAGGTP